MAADDYTESAKREAWLALWWEGARAILQMPTEMRDNDPKLLADACDQLVASLVERAPSINPEELANSLVRGERQHALGVKR